MLLPGTTSSGFAMKRSSFSLSHTKSAPFMASISITRAESALASQLADNLDLFLSLLSDGAVWAAEDGEYLDDLAAPLLFWSTIAWPIGAPVSSRLGVALGGYAEKSAGILSAKPQAALLYVPASIYRPRSSRSRPNRSRRRSRRLRLTNPSSKSSA